jgi:ATP adenylyltransferase/5',5'''-P-1,P-4-tetraphosphate phosphorylase II
MSLYSTSTVSFQNTFSSSQKVLVCFCLVVIIEFESQADDLNNQDISIIWDCLKKMERGNERWLAFYNCGEASGARYAGQFT